MRVPPRHRIAEYRPFPGLVMPGSPPVHLGPLVLLLQSVRARGFHSIPFRVVTFRSVLY